METMRQDAERAVMNIKGVSKVTAILTAEKSKQNAAKRARSAWYE